MQLAKVFAGVSGLCQPGSPGQTSNAVPGSRSWCCIQLKMARQTHHLGPSVVPFYPLFWLGGFPYYNRLQKKGILILPSLLEDLVKF